MRKILSLLFVLLSIPIYSQNLDSLYNKYLIMRGQIITNPKENTVESESEEKEKCGFGIVAQIMENFDNFSPDQQITLRKILSRPSMDTSFVSPKGYFRIHFNKSDFPDYVPDNIRSSLTTEQLASYKKIYLDSMAIAADSVYNYEVNILEYPAPPSDGTEGGDGLYDIYVENTGSIYGETVFNSGSTISYLRMDNDFSNYYTTRIYAARVTLAHEFHHAIQIGGYLYRSSDTYYYELTSTSMEEFVFDDVNDYYQYLNSFIKYTYKSFANTTGYNMAVWNLFLASKFGMNIIKETWDLMPTERALNAISDAISNNSSSFKNEYADFGTWLYYTGSRAKSGEYFDEAAKYPQVKALVTTEFTKPQTTVTINSYPVSTNYLKFYDGTDTLTVMVSNSDITNGVSSMATTTSFDFYLADKAAAGFTKYLDGYYGKIISEDEQLLSAEFFFNNTSITTTEEINYPFPQPFKYSTDDVINFPSSTEKSGSVDLYIYSIDMDRVYSGKTTITKQNQKVVVQWNCIDDSGKKLGSGIYLYVIKFGDDIDKGKFAIIND
jgi:hypothetical protein